jgi:energy-converting hydrogenase Eha subunit A
MLFAGVVAGQLALPIIARERPVSSGQQPSAAITGYSGNWHGE